MCAACKYSCLLMSIRLFVILYMIVSLCACLRFSSKSLFICLLISDVMLGVFSLHAAGSGSQNVMKCFVGLMIFCEI